MRKLFVLCLGFFLFFFLVNLFFSVNYNVSLWGGVDSFSYFHNIEFNFKPYPLTYLVLETLVDSVPGRNLDNFFYFNCILLFFLIPFLLFKLTDSLVSVLFYLSSYFVYGSFLGGIFSTALISVLFLLVFVIKNPLIRIFFVLLSFGFHGFEGFIFVFLAFCLVSFFENKKFLVCIPPLSMTKVKIDSIDVVRNNFFFNFDFTHVFNLLFRNCFFPLYYFIFKECLKKENFQWIILFIFVFLSALFVPDCPGCSNRILSLIVFPLSVLIGKSFKNENVFNKKLILLFILIQIIINIFFWFKLTDFNYCILQI